MSDSDEIIIMIVNVDILSKSILPLSNLSSSERGKRKLYYKRCAYMKIILQKIYKYTANDSYKFRKS